MSVINSGSDTRETLKQPEIWVPADLNQPLEAMPLSLRIGGWVANPYKNYLLPVTWLQRLLKSSQSELLAETFRRPGGWRTMEMMYRNREPVDSLDRQALQDNPIARASRNRLQLVTQKLMELMRQYAETEKVTVVGVGAGPGRHVQTAISRLNFNADQIAAYLIDLDDDAFEYGHHFSQQLGIADGIHFLQGDARQIHKVLPEVKPHIVKLIGLVEYLDDAQFSELLGALHKVMLPGGTLITHGLVDPYNGSPFLKRVFGLQHVKRSANDIKRLLESAGFRTLDQITEPMQIYPVITVVKDA
ncbi:class I SAM-dependent methyltransferase family protein [Gimesia fumaroli]|uniref:Lysophospholipase n=1 Tax=Gimesia fumaroli TaxID=2527976 RepID=A0A518IJ81_9PLAN|nr:class I SAM-dependent methyltransferase family protein [Gimesia fumaroli]QDV53110.1 Putative lysophospholipase [Gimesia fumaroli]